MPLPPGAPSRKRFRPPSHSLPGRGWLPVFAFHTEKRRIIIRSSRKVPGRRMASIILRHCLPARRANTTLAPPAAKKDVEIPEYPSRGAGEAFNPRGAFKPARASANARPRLGILFSNRCLARLETARHPRAVHYTSPVVIELIGTWINSQVEPGNGFFHSVVQLREAS